MSENIERVVDRTGWGKGPWNSEPDRLDFIHAGFSCFILRNDIGAWCGYVGVPETHPAFGKDYNSVDVDAHGGLTYAELCSPPICHIPETGMPEKVWWLGFDTAHSGDAPPGMPRWASSGVYRDMDYTREATERLAQQLA